MRGSKKENPVPIWERTTLTLMEAVQYTGIGRDKLRDAYGGSQRQLVRS